MIYVLICLSLSLAGVAGLQFFYMIYLEQMGKGYKQRIRELERHCIKLSARVEKAEEKLEAQKEALTESSKGQDEEEVWADVLDDH